jgi:hypothetical protein
MALKATSESSVSSAQETVGRRRNICFQLAVPEIIHINHFYSHSCGENLLYVPLDTREIGNVVPDWCATTQH